jgi:hypothetical protein
MASQSQLARAEKQRLETAKASAPATPKPPVTSAKLQNLTSKFFSIAKPGEPPNSPPPTEDNPLPYASNPNENNPPQPSENSPPPRAPLFSATKKKSPPIQTEITEEAFSRFSQLAKEINVEVLNGKQEISIKKHSLQLLTHLQERHGFEHHISLALIYALFLKGAANKGAHENLEATLRYNNENISLSKRELLSAYKFVSGNPHLRRLAEFLATEISEYGAAHKEPGDLFNKTQLLLKPEDSPLNIEERAWCSSFNRHNPDCADRYPRVSRLLTEEYNRKFKYGASVRQTNESTPKPKSYNPRKQ